MNYESENISFLNFIHALQGNVSENVRAVSLTLFPDSIIFHFILHRDDPETNEDIDDVVAEFAALQQQFTQIDLDVRATDLPIDLSTFPGRLVFLKKDKRSY